MFPYSVCSHSKYHFIFEVEYGVEFIFLLFDSCVLYLPFVPESDHKQLKVNLNL